jgi:hypothetical protein
MFPGHSGSKYGGILELLKPKSFAVGGLVLGIEPFCPPAGIVFGCLEGEVGNIWAHLAVEAASLEWQRAPNNKNSAPQRLVGFNPQKTLTKRDEARNV